MGRTVKGTIAATGILSALCLVIMGCGSNAARGAVLFESEGCRGCHTFQGKGGTNCPDLTEVTKRRSDRWIRDQIRNPWLHYTNPEMPAHEYLSSRQINDLLKYLKSSQKGGATGNP